ncbi:MAG: hypothetical protein IK106_07890 [Clostridiales bacterium]|nr:hypothetical protein [Clostridiales bacterium]
MNYEEKMNYNNHKTMADLIDEKILTEKNSKRVKRLCKYSLIGFLALLAVDFISFIVVLLTIGLPM